LLGRLLHDRTADQIAAVVSRIPGASAQIVAYDIASRIAQAQAEREASSKPPGRRPQSTAESQVITPIT
jgi:hypothetical protein